MATLAVTNLSSSGVTQTLAAAAGGGDVFPNDGKTIFVVNNGSGGSINVTFTAQTTSAEKPGMEDITYSDKVVAVANGAIKMIGPFATGTYNNPSGQVAVSYSSATSVTVAAFRINPKG
jgi:hypothetical protein